MKTAKSFQELAIESVRQHDNKRDVLVTSNEVLVLPNFETKEIDLAFNTRIEASLGVGRFQGGFTQNGHRQLGLYTGIPAPYYDRMIHAPELLAHNLNHWLHNNKPEKRLVRTLDGRTRAWLSASYRILDNATLLEKCVLPYVKGKEKLVVESCEITEKRLYIKIVNYQLQGEVSKGDVVCSGVIITNSEVGHGSLSIKPFIYRLACLNGAVVDLLATRKYHVGRKNDNLGSGFEFSRKVNEHEDRLFWMKTKELVDGSLSEATFKKALTIMQQSTQLKVEVPTHAIELATKKFGFTEDESESILNHFIREGNLNSWGVGNAITRHAHDVESYDRATELESAGFLAMQQSWN